MDSLPTEVWTGILMHLDFPQLSAFSRTSHSANKLCQTRDFLRQCLYQWHDVCLPLETDVPLVHPFVYIDIVERSRIIDVLIPEEESCFARWGACPTEFGPAMGVLVLDAVKTGNSHLVSLVLDTVVTRILEYYLPLNIGHIRSFRDAYVEASRQRNVEMMNLILRHYDPFDSCEVTFSPRDIKDIVPVFPELAWILYYHHVKGADTDLIEFLRSKMMLTERYYQAEPLQYYRRQLYILKEFAGNDVESITACEKIVRRLTLCTCPEEDDPTWYPVV